MICARYDKLYIPENLKNRNWEKAFAWLKAESWKNLPLGKTEIDGENVYVTRSAYTNKLRAECLYESHRRYADIQMALNGNELIQVCSRDGLKIEVPYSEKDDLDFLNGEPETIHGFVLGFPLALILFPWDLHMPKLALDDIPGEVEKIVVKVAL